MRKTYGESEINDFYCIRCGRLGIPISRRAGHGREAGHLKVLYCLNCKAEVNFCEIKHGATRYTYQDFLLEYENGNFDEKGNRKKSYGQFKQDLVKEGKLQKLLLDISMRNQVEGD